MLVTENFPWVIEEKHGVTLGFVRLEESSDGELTLVSQLGADRVLRTWLDLERPSAGPH